MDNEFNFKQELRNIFEKELLGKTTNAGRIYRKLLARDKEFIKIYNSDIEDCVIIKMKDVPKHMVGIDLTWLDKEIGKIKDRLRNKLRERAGKNLK